MELFGYQRVVGHNYLVPKKGEQWRPYGDYRALNARTIPDRYRVRHIKDFSQALQGKTIFCSLSLYKACHQIPGAEEDILKTVVTPFDMYEFWYMSEERGTNFPAFGRHPERPGVLLHIY